jgi:lipopolysaccharide export LptBFGC system permease protein LptF
MKIYHHEKQQKLDAVEAQLARHQKLTRITFMVILILAGLALAVVAKHLFDHSTTNIQ